MINTNHVDIISTSLGWYNITPGDGTGEFASLVQTARNAGVLWVTAAGNDREAHWGGAYNDSDGDQVHNFNGPQEINYFGPGDGSGYLIPSGYVFTVAVRWDDWINVNQDFDLYLLRLNGSDWEVVGYSWNEQTGVPGQEPTEFAQVVTSGADAVYGIEIDCYSCSRNVNFEVFAPKLERLDEVVNARSLANLADAPAAVTVAALDVVSPYPQEPYSSEGPTNGPGGTAVGGIVKPDISGFANISTVSYGTTNKFNGTSSATPHVAGAAALVLSAYPSYTPDQLQTYLQGRAVDMGSAGKDNDFGYGRLNLGTPPDFSMTVTGISPNSSMANQTVPVTITGTNFLNANAVKITKTGQSDVAATNFTIVNATTITANINLSGIQPGDWNVVITSPGNFSAQLANGFTVWVPSSFIYIPMLIK
jgi:subtilisin family serine protease